MVFSYLASPASHPGATPHPTTRYFLPALPLPIFPTSTFNIQGCLRHCRESIGRDCEYTCMWDTVAVMVERHDQVFFLIFTSRQTLPPLARCRSSMANGLFSDFLASKSPPPPWPLSCNSSAPFLLSNTLDPTSPQLLHSSLPGAFTWQLLQPPLSAPSSTTGERAWPRSCWTAPPPSSRSSPPS